MAHSQKRRRLNVFEETAAFLLMTMAIMLLTVLIMLIWPHTPQTEDRNILVILIIMGTLWLVGVILLIAQPCADEEEDAQSGDPPPLVF